MLTDRGNDNEKSNNEEDQEEIVTYLDDMKEKLEEGKEVKKPFIKKSGNSCFS